MHFCHILQTLQWLRGPNYDVAEEVKALEFEGSPAKKDELAKNNEKSKVSQMDNFKGLHFVCCK